MKRHISLPVTILNSFALAKEVFLEGFLIVNFVVSDRVCSFPLLTIMKLILWKKTDYFICILMIHVLFKDR